MKLISKCSDHVRERRIQKAEKRRSGETLNFWRSSINATNRSSVTLDKYERHDTCDSYSAEALEEERWTECDMTTE